MSAKKEMMEKFAKEYESIQQEEYSQKESENSKQNPEKFSIKDSHITKKYAISSSEFRSAYGEQENIDQILRKKRQAEEKIDKTQSKPSIKSNYKKLRVNTKIRKYDKKIASSSKAFKKDTLKMLDKFEKISSPESILEIAQKASPEAVEKIIHSLENFEQFIGKNEQMFAEQKIALFKGVKELKEVFKEIQKGNFESSVNQKISDLNETKSLEKLQNAIKEAQESVKETKFGMASNKISVTQSSKIGGYVR